MHALRIHRMIGAVGDGVDGAKGYSGIHAEPIDNVRDEALEKSVEEADHEDRTELTGGGVGDGLHGTGGAGNGQAGTLNHC